MWHVPWPVWRLMLAYALMSVLEIGLKVSTLPVVALRLGRGLPHDVDANVGVAAERRITRGEDADRDQAPPRAHALEEGVAVECFAHRAGGDAAQRADGAGVLLEAADQGRYVGAALAGVGVHLVEDDVLQVAEQLGPLGVVRQDALVQHVRIADHDVAAGAHRLACIPRGVAVEGEGPHPEVGGPVQFTEFRHLVLGQGLRRVEEEGGGLRLLEETLENGNGYWVKATATTQINLAGGRADQRRQHPAHRATGRGESVLPPAVASVVVRHLAGKTPSAPQDELTPREMQVLHLLAEGQSNRQIARHLSLSVRTVEAHLHNIYGKLGVNNRTQAANQAKVLGLLPSP
mgnify:CR=1 FL=1